MKIDIPERLIRVAEGVPQIDVEKRTVRCVVATRCLARDGGIVIPEGIITKHFEKNPVVLARHGIDFGSAHSPVVGNSRGLTLVEQGMESVTQFAETDLGREYAYLYGINAQKEVYMRAWSFGWRTLKCEYWGLDKVQGYLGSAFDPATAAGLESVWVSTSSEMHEYSCVAVGADREALSRAFGAGVRAAGTLVAELDLRASAAEIEQLKTFQGCTSRKLAELEKEIQALRRDGAAAAARGDSAAIRSEVGELLRIARNINQASGNQSNRTGV